jgi:hypothetical protein
MRPSGFDHISGYFFAHIPCDILSFSPSYFFQYAKRREFPLLHSFFNNDKTIFVLFSLSCGNNPEIYLSIINLYGVNA